MISTLTANSNPPQVSAEANDVSDKESKKTIAVEHVEQALRELGFGDYCEPIKGVVGEWKVVQTKRINRGERMKNWGGTGASEEELQKIQEQLLLEAKTRMDGEPSSAV